MPSSSDHPDRPRTVVLPSGRRVAVTFFAPPPPRELHICPACAHELVYPTCWHEAGPEHWKVSRRCPSCEWRGTALHGQGLVDRFDERLDRATDTMLADLRRLARANMEDEVVSFARELSAGRIGAEDFRRGAC